ncbi:hypothetical protein A3L04_02690 [Thermococcus chitonophagus]|uniref:Glycosyltransferase RgtA/B/C/D-like domain-containing protein n=1 Tax=Thermococcus chitonophagus TaxID=54262 RepID=A0A2Z2N624_9EURY|nr:glycosyltransferase family 39 protein [Thermococcus chitonophagus]ASJ16063.1 hypothetical protein A3L04_02690 [Thermococcus chitonophagus]
MKRIFVLWFALIFLPLFTLRLFQDEMLYINLSKLAFSLTFRPRSSLVFLLTSPLAVVSNVHARVFLLRLSTSLATLLDVLLIYKIAEKLFGKREAFLSSILFLFAFTVLRYGARYTLEPWGTLFMLLAVYWLEDKPLLSSIFAGLAFWARESWLVVWPFYLYYARITKRREFLKIFVVSLVVVTLNFLFMYLVSIGYGGFEKTTVITYPSRTIMSFSSLIPLLIRDWIEFIVAYPLITIGFLYALKEKSSLKVVSIGALFTLNGIIGFIINGPFERYAFGSLAFASIFAGRGLVLLYEKFKVGFSLEKVLAIFLIAKFVVFNIAVIEFSDIGAEGIQDYGYWYDAEVFKILSEHANPQEFLAGTPHPLLLGFRNYCWPDRNISKAISWDPDWLITFKAWVTINNTKDLEVWYVGPYVVIHAKRKGAIKENVHLGNLEFWKLRK